MALRPPAIRPLCQMYAAFPPQCPAPRWPPPFSSRPCCLTLFLDCLLLLRSVTMTRPRFPPTPSCSLPLLFLILILPLIVCIHKSSALMLLSPSASASQRAAPALLRCRFPALPPPASATFRRCSRRRLTLASSPCCLPSLFSSATPSLCCPPPKALALPSPPRSCPPSAAMPGARRLQPVPLATPHCRPLFLVPSYSPRQLCSQPSAPALLHCRLILPSPPPVPLPFLPNLSPQRYLAPCTILRPAPLLPRRCLAQ
jgi:hypothetical protein